MFYNVTDLVQAVDGYRRLKGGDSPVGPLPIHHLPIVPLLDANLEWVFLGFIVVSLVLLVTAIWLVVENYDRMPKWAAAAAILSIILPIPGGSIIAIVLALVVRN